MTDQQVKSDQGSIDGILVSGGPFEGAVLPRRAAPPATVVLEGDGVPEGMVARYRYSPKRDEYTFMEYDTVMLRVPR